MNLTVKIAGDDYTDRTLLDQTRINLDSTARVSTATIAVLMAAATLGAQYDFASYDAPDAIYGETISEMQRVELRNADDQSLLFAGIISALTLKQTDSPERPLQYQADLNDDGVWLDRSVAWGGIEIPMPTSDAQLISTIITQFCPRIRLGTIQSVLPVIDDFEWVGKTCRQILDDVATLANARRLHCDAQLRTTRERSSCALQALDLAQLRDVVPGARRLVEARLHDADQPRVRLWRD